MLGGRGKTTRTGKWEILGAASGAVDASFWN